MPLTREVTGDDREFFARELETIVPAKVFGAHAHLYELWHWNAPDGLRHGPTVASLSEYQRQIDWLTPKRKTSGLFFGTGFGDEAVNASNEYVSHEVSNDPGSRGLLVVSPRQSAEFVATERKRLGFVGFKVYHTFSKRSPT